MKVNGLGRPKSGGVCVCVCGGGGGGDSGSRRSMHSYILTYSRLERETICQLCVLKKREREKKLT